ncbi:MAG: hypothetical protein QG650_485 [Patescibacteria group bacterium]|nr:hypothetical protein [Patescibacteria group bacterium]
MVAISPSIKKCESGSIYGKATREFVSGLKLPRAGGRSYATGNYFNQGSTANYWTSTAHQNVAHTIHFVTTVILDPHYGLSRAYGFPVRCIKN